MTDEKSIYDLKLHESMAVHPTSIDQSGIQYFSVLRVPGGWIYQVWDNDKQDYVREIFIPYYNGSE
jgi:hypothetical protein